jgi:CBS domain-containing protein
MKVEALMNRDVVTVPPDASLKDIAAALVDHRITGLPVCDSAGHVLGVVSAGDLLFKEQGSDGTGNKAKARTAREAMSAPAVVIEPQRPVSAAARLMLERHVTRLPVVRQGRLVGIVTRTDLIRAFNRSDEDVKRELYEDVLARVLWIDPARVTITVECGEVRLSGLLDSKTEAELVAAFAATVPGVVSVESELTWSFDDQARRTRSPRRLSRV